MRKIQSQASKLVDNFTHLGCVIEKDSSEERMFDQKSAKRQKYSEERTKSEFVDQSKNISTLQNSDI